MFCPKQILTSEEGSCKWRRLPFRYACLKTLWKALTNMFVLIPQTHSVAICPFLLPWHPFIDKILIESSSFLTTSKDTVHFYTIFLKADGICVLQQGSDHFVYFSFHMKVSNLFSPCLIYMPNADQFDGVIVHSTYPSIVVLVCSVAHEPHWLYDSAFLFYDVKKMLMNVVSSSLDRHQATGNPDPNSSTTMMVLKVKP